MGFNKSNENSAHIFGTDISMFVQKIPTLPHRKVEIKMRMEKQPFEDVSPIKSGDFPLSYYFSGGTLPRN